MCDMSDDMSNMKNSSRDYAKKNVSARTAQDMLRIASERLSTVRYVFIVHIESGIPSAASRAALEYADAVLIGWPDSDASDVVKPNHSEAEKAEDAFKSMEKHMGTFRAAEKRNDVKEMTDSIIAVCGAVAAVRKAYQPGFPLPTFAEISRVVQAEWSEDMDRIASESDRMVNSDDETGLVNAEMYIESESQNGSQSGAQAGSRS